MCEVMTRNGLCRVGSSGVYYDHCSLGPSFITRDLPWPYCDICPKLHVMSKQVATWIAEIVQAARPNNNGFITFVGFMAGPGGEEEHEDHARRRRSRGQRRGQ